MNALWPDRRPFVLALSHDVDRVAKGWQFLYYLGRAVARFRPDLLWQQLQSLRARLRGDDPYWNFERITQLEEELDVRSTFFFLNESGRARLSRPRSVMLFWGRYAIDDAHIEQVIQNLYAGGWEIGLHGSFFSYRDPALLRREKRELEAVLGSSVVGVRQHYLNLDIPETWRAQAEAGLIYDSSLGFSDRVDLRWGTSRPFYPKDPLTGEAIPILQIPLGIMDTPLMQVHDPRETALSLIARVEQERGVLTLNWHQRSFNSWEYGDRQDAYAWIVRECQRREAWVATCRDVACWWSRQDAEIYETFT